MVRYAREAEMKAQKSKIEKKNLQSILSLKVGR